MSSSSRYQSGLDRGTLRNHSDKLLSTVALVVVVTSSGRLLGFIRDLLIARYFGADAETDAFVIAWMIPETVSPLLLEGAMLLVLVPLFAQELEKKGTIKGLVPRTLSSIAAVLLVLSAAVAFSAPWTVPLLAPGLSVSTEQEAVRMVGVTSVTIFFIGLAGYARAVLNSYQIFGVPSAVFAAYNLGILGSILLLHERLGIYSAALGLALGSVLMLLVQAPALVRKVGVPRLSLKFDRTLLYDFAAFVPVVVFVLSRHAQVYVERFLGSFLEPGVISQLNYATRLAQFPMFAAITVALVSFPALARAAAAGQMREVEQTTENNLKMVGALILPAATFLIVFAPELVTLLLERGAFTAEDTVATASILRIYSLGLLGQSMVYVLVRSFFTHQSGSIWLPSWAALTGLAVTIAIDVTLLQSLGADGLAVGNAAGISAVALLLILYLKRCGVNINWHLMASFFVRAFAAVLLAASCTLPLVFFRTLTGLPASATLFLGGVILGCAYLFLGKRFGIAELEELQNQAKRLLARASH